MEESVAIRLKVFMDEMGLSNSQFADQCGIPRPSLSQLLTGRNKKISDVLVGQIHTAFPRLSVLWLLFGEGQMLSPVGADDNDSDKEPNLFTQAFTNATKDTENSKYPNLRGLNDAPDTTKSAGNNANTIDFKTVELQHEIEKMRKNPRKVVQITVYYDDSTFETFYPGK